MVKQNSNPMMHLKSEVKLWITRANVNSIALLLIVILAGGLRLINIGAVGLNSDESVRRIKGEKRPILSEHERTFILSNLKPVDYVVLFDEDTPLRLIEELLPDILVKGADWPIDNIVGADAVVANGGEVKTVKFLNDQSTSKIIQKIVAGYKSN